jgi:uncharacterized protein YbaR (Trm112 family)
MWNRKCPLCFARAPRSLILTVGNDLACPTCHTPLELSRASRVAGAFGGLLCGFVLGHVACGLTRAAWVLPMVLAVLAYGVGSASVLYFLSDLVVQPKLR